MVLSSTNPFINFLSNLSTSVLASIIATLIILVLGFLFRKYIFGFLTNMRLVRCITDSGMKNFYYNREMLINQLGPIGTEISKAKTEFIYIGYAMSGVIKQNFSDAVIKAINERNVKFKICIFDKTSEIIDSYVAYTGESKEAIVQSLKIEVINCAITAVAPNILTIISDVITFSSSAIKRDNS